MSRSKVDPMLAKMLERREELLAEFERTYGRLARNFRRLDKCRKQLGRLDRRVRLHKAALAEGGAS